MTAKTTTPSNGASSRPSRSLAERVKAHVAETTLTLESAPGKGKAKAKARRAASQLAMGADAQREAESLIAVYSEMRTTYRRYRKETGSPAVPALREAVRAFKRGRSLTSLVGVATFLDERGLLAW